MNSIIISSTSQNEITDPFSLKHLHEVIKVKVHDKLKLNVLNQGIFEAQVDFVSEKKISFKDLKLLHKKKSWITILVGASRPQTAKKILEHGSTYGVAKFHFFKSSLSEKSYLTSKVYEPNEASQLMQLGLAQSARYSALPEVEVSLFNPASLYQDYDYKFLLDLKDAKRFDNVDFSNFDDTKKIIVAIGPERGWTSDDLKYFKEANFTPISISGTVLRVEHALYSTLGVLEFVLKKY